MGTLKPQINGPLYSNNTVLGTLVVDGWAATFGTARSLGDGAPQSPLSFKSSPLFAVPNVTAHPSTASVPIAVLLYNGPLLCGFDVPVKGLRLWFAMQLSVCRGTWRRPWTVHRRTSVNVPLWLAFVVRRPPSFRGTARPSSATSARKLFQLPIAFDFNKKRPYTGSVE